MTLIAGFFPIQLQRFHYRPVVDGKKHRFIIAEIFMGMPLPERHHEAVAFSPFEITFANLECGPGL